MSPQAHFWLRIFGLALILAAEFGPRMWTNPGVAAARVQAASAAANVR